MELLEYISALSVPLVICISAFILIFGKKAKLSDFLEGAEAGLKTAFSLMPTLTLIIVGISMLTASGATDYLARLISPLTDRLGIPSEVLPLLITRPFSGSASMASYDQLMTAEGADSLAAFCAAIIMGSSDTIVYIIGVYFSSVGVTKSRYAIPCAFAVMLFCVFFACFLGRIFF